MLRRSSCSIAAALLLACAATPQTSEPPTASAPTPAASEATHVAEPIADPVEPAPATDASEPVAVVEQGDSTDDGFVPD